MHYRFFVIFLCLLASGCGSSWKHVDSSTVDESMLNKALNECKYEEKRKMSHHFYAGSHTDNSGVNERMKADGDKIYQEAVSCMKSKGFTK